MGNNDLYSQRLPQSAGVTGMSLKSYTAKTFLLMFLGLLVTFITAMFFSFTYAGAVLLRTAFTLIPIFHIVLLVAQLVVVICMSAMVRKMTPTTAAVCFIVYALLTGVTFTVYFIIYDVGSMILVFGATALYFGGMAVFGYVTDIDLCRIRTVLIGGLIFLIVFNVLMMFIPGLAVLDRVLCTVGVVIFLAFTAYDTQKIKVFYQVYSGNEAMLQKTAILSALELYLDFINMFRYLLQIFGDRKK